MNNQPLTIRCAGICEPSNRHGFACWAYVVSDQHGEELHVDFGCVGYGAEQTNQVASFTAIIQAFKWATEHANGTQVAVETHALNIVQQVNREYQCKAAHLRPLCEVATAFLVSGNIALRWIGKADNAAVVEYAHLAYREALAASRKEAA